MSLPITVDIKGKLIGIKTKLLVMSSFVLIRVGREGFAPPKAHGQHVYSVPSLTTSVPAQQYNILLYSG